MASACDVGSQDPIPERQMPVTFKNTHTQKKNKKNKQTKTTKNKNKRKGGVRGMGAGGGVARGDGHLWATLPHVIGHILETGWPTVSIS